MILLLLSTLFTFAIALMGLVAGSTGKLSSLVGCNTAYSGILSVWNSVDNYLVQVDQQFCSPNCPCAFTNTTGYTSNSTIAPYYNQWTQSPNGATSFSNCSSTVQNTAMTQYSAQSNSTTINSTLFASSFGNIETFFKCAGLCTTSYTTPNGTNMVMYKYMFSNINK